MHIVNIFKLKLINWTIEYLSRSKWYRIQDLKWTANARLGIYGDFTDLIFLEDFFTIASNWKKNDPFLRSFTKQSGSIKLAIMMAMDSKEKHKNLQRKDKVDSFKGIKFYSRPLK
jgi:hypothetical protein